MRQPLSSLMNCVLSSIVQRCVKCGSTSDLSNKSSSRGKAYRISWGHPTATERRSLGEMVVRFASGLLLLTTTIDWDVPTRADVSESLFGFPRMSAASTEPSITADKHDPLSSYYENSSLWVKAFQRLHSFSVDKFASCWGIGCCKDKCSGGVTFFFGKLG